MPSQIEPLFDRIDTWLEDLRATKQASAPKTQQRSKKAAPAGVGKTSHPSDDVDNNTHNTPYGERYSENERDVKADVPASVDESEEGLGADEDKVMPNIGVNQAATGEEPSVERDFKGDKDDGTTSHPADAEDVGEKYSSYDLPRLLKTAEDKANALLADIGNGLFVSQPSKPAAPKPAAKQASASVTQNAQAVQQQLVNGYNQAAAAGVAENQLTEADLEKMASAFIAQTMQDADRDADLVGAYFTTWYTKKAEGEEEGGEAPPAEAGGASPEAPPPPGMPPADGGMPPMPPGAGAGAPGDAGMPPPDAGAGDAGGGDPLAALGAATQDAQPSAGDKEKALQDLAMALQELGLSEDQLAQLAQAHGAGDEGQKMASAVIAYKRSGKFSFSGAPKTAAEKRSRAMIKDYVRDLTGLK